MSDVTRSPIDRLRVRRDFLAAAKSQKQVAPGLVLQARAIADSSAIRFGLTATKKIGGAVTRNRVRRRLRALAYEILPHKGRAGFDYVLIGRFSTAKRPYIALRNDLQMALRRIHKAQ